MAPSSTHRRLFYAPTNPVPIPRPDASGPDPCEVIGPSFSEGWTLSRMGRSTVSFLELNP